MRPDWNTNLFSYVNTINKISLVALYGPQVTIKNDCIEMYTQLTKEVSYFCDTVLYFSSAKHPMDRTSKLISS